MMKKSNTVLVAAMLMGASGIVLAQNFSGSTADEQAAVSRVEAVKTDEIQRLNQACDANASATIQWQGYADLSDADLQGRTRDNVFQIAENQALDVLGYITASCGSDAAFKKKVSQKLKTVQFTPSKGTISVKNPSHTFSLNNGVLSVRFNFQSSDSSIDSFKKLF